MSLSSKEEYPTRWGYEWGGRRSTTLYKEHRRKGGVVETNKNRRKSRTRCIASLQFYPALCDRDGGDMSKSNTGELGAVVVIRALSRSQNMHMMSSR